MHGLISFARSPIRFSSLIAGFALVAFFAGALAAPEARAQACAAPFTSQSPPVSSDCLFLLRAAVGLQTCLQPCICDPTADEQITASDALACLRAAVGQPQPLSCPCGEPDADNDGLLEDDPCPSDPRNRCFGPAAVDENTGNVIRINANTSSSECAGTKTDCAGDVWLADFGFNQAGGAFTCDLDRGGERCVITGIVELFGCEDESTEDLFQCEHFGEVDPPDLTYTFAVPNGAYLVNLFFAEISSDVTAAGQRTFDVVIEEEIQYDDLDPFAAAGGAGIAIVRSSLVNVDDASLLIRFERGLQNPAVKAIEVLRQDPTGTSTTSTQPMVTTTTLATTTTTLPSGTTTTIPPGSTTTTLPATTTTTAPPTTTTLPPTTTTTTLPPTTTTTLPSETTTTIPPESTTTTLAPTTTIPATTTTTTPPTTLPPTTTTLPPTTTTTTLPPTTTTTLPPTTTTTSTTSTSVPSGEIVLFSAGVQPSGALGSRATTSQACAMAATDQGLACVSTVGLLSYGTDAVAGFPGTYAVPTDEAIVAGDPAVEIASDWADFLDGQWDTCLKASCSPPGPAGAGIVGIGGVWTGTASDGSADAARCDDWSTDMELSSGTWFEASCYGEDDGLACPGAATLDANGTRVCSTDTLELVCLCY